MSWAWKPERASECMNGRHKCKEFWCENLLKKPGYCMKCRRKQKELLKLQTAYEEKIVE